MEKSLVSVLINCYNGENYVEKAIRSAINQSYTNLEIIFWDNKSNDNTSKIVKNFGDKRIKYYLSKKHTSQYEARNEALKRCTGEYIAFLESDDWWDSNKLVKQIYLFNNPAIGFSCTNAWIINERNNKKYIAFKKIPNGDPLSNLLKQDFITMSSLIVKKDTLNKLEHNFNSTYKMIGDFDLVLRLSLVTEFKSIQDPLTYYRQHFNNLTHTKIILNILELSELLNQLEKNLSIKNNKNFYIFKNNVLFNRVLMFSLEGKRKLGIKEMLKITRIKILIKAMIILSLPKEIILKLRSLKNE